MYINKIDKTIDALLETAGLIQSERTMYAAGVRLGRAKSSQLAREVVLPRVTVQLALKGLVEKGICKTYPLNKRSFLYEMLPPAALQPFLRQKIALITTVMDDLSQVDAHAHVQVTVEQAEGQTGVQGLIERALRCRSREWYIIAPHDNALRYMSPEYIRYFKRVRKERSIQSKTLWEAARKSDDIGLRDVLMRKPRYMPSSTGSIPALVVAFDEYVLTIEGTETPIAVLVHSRSAAQTIMQLFDVAWQARRSTKT